MWVSSFFSQSCMFTYYCFHQGFLLITFIILRERIIECGISHGLQKKAYCFFLAVYVSWKDSMKPSQPPHLAQLDVAGLRLFLNIWFPLHPERAATLNSVRLLVFTILSFQSLCKAYYHRWGLECWLTTKHRALSSGSVLQMLESTTVCIFNRVFTLKFIFSRTGVETFRQVSLLVVTMLLLSFVILRSHLSFWLNHSLCWLHIELQNLLNKYKTIWAVAFHDCVVICILLWHTETDFMCLFIYLSPCFFLKPPRLLYGVHEIILLSWIPHEAPMCKACHGIGFSLLCHPNVHCYVLGFIRNHSIAC